MRKCRYKKTKTSYKKLKSGENVKIDYRVVKKLTNFVQNKNKIQEFKEKSQKKFFWSILLHAEC